MTLTQHPLSAAFPAMSAEDFQALKDDIESNGQREPVMIFEGMVLDGWHRYQACVQLGLKPLQFTFGDEDPVAFVISHNLHRRHLTASQRAAAVVACTAWAPKGRPGKPEPGSGFSLEKDLAKAAGTSDRTIRDAKVAHKAGLGEAVRDGAITAKQGASVARGKPASAPKPAPTPVPAPAPSVAPEELADAQEAVKVLAEENERLNDRLAVEAMNASEEEKGKAAETIADLRAQVKTLTAELAAVKASRDAYMRDCSEMQKQIKAQRRDLDKLRKVEA